MRVVVLDDDRAIGQLMCRIADRAGFATTLTTNGTDFRTEIEQSHPDVVILDLALADTDGVKQLLFLKDALYGGAIVLVSGFDRRVLTTTEFFARQLGLKVAGALTKPVRAQVLQDLLQQLTSEAEVVTGKRVFAAIRGGELALEYQPIVTQRGGTVLRLEALVRWNHPTLGRIMPLKFVPVAEQNQEIMDALTDWVIDTAIHDYADLRSLGLSIPMAVNVSSVNLHDTAFPDRLHDHLVGSAVPAEHFSIEITEGAASHDPFRDMEILTRLRLHGVRLAIDDFGTGYSSLKQLQRMPFSALKIDGSFVMAATSSPDAVAIIKAIVAMGHAMGLRLVAECIENDETANLLESLGVEAAQGFLFARPMGPRDISTWMSGRDIKSIE